jgi:outer membrane protein insertion porin family
VHDQVDAVGSFLVDHQALPDGDDEPAVVFVEVELDATLAVLANLPPAARASVPCGATHASNARRCAPVSGRMKRCWIIVGSLVAAPAHADEATETAPAETEREPTGSFEIGAGYSSDDAFLAHAAVGQDDLFHTGQHLSLQTDLSATRHRAVLAHELPDLLGSGLSLRSELFTGRRLYPGFTREATGGQLTLAKQVGATRFYARYRAEYATLGFPDMEGAARGGPGAPILGPGPIGDGMLATLGGGVEYSTLDAPVLPLLGTRLHLWAERADRRWGSAYDLDRAGVDVEHARPLGPLTLRLRGGASRVWSRERFGVPLAHRLFHDGHAEVRGFALDQGPRFGDNLEAHGSVEVELPLVKKHGLSIAGWHDLGYRDNLDGAWGAPGSLVQRSLGASIIWRSPIGLMRFDWAFPLDDKTREPQFLFSLGGGF